MRPSWDNYFLDIAKTVATRSTCPRLSVGCVLVADHRILTCGYNGSPSGLDHCTDVGCLMQNDSCVRTIHAEQNAIVQAAILGIALSGCTAYITHFPCLTCVKLLINCDVHRIVYNTFYPNFFGEKFLLDTLIKVEQICE